MVFKTCRKISRSLGMAGSLAVAAVIMFLAQAGCSTAPHLQSYTRSETDFSATRKIAVFPLESLTQDEFAGERIRRLVIAELLDRGFEVIEPGEVASVLSTVTANKPLWAINKEDIRKTGKALGVDAVIMGAVETYKISPGLTSPYPDVSISLRLLSVSSAEILWSATHTSGGPSYWTRHFGSEGMTLPEAARKVVREAVARLP